jgi:hypothetical protein
VSSEDKSVPGHSSLINFFAISIDRKKSFYLISDHLCCFLYMLGDDPRSGQPHEERDEEEAEEHDEDQQELALVHRVQPETHEVHRF